MFFNKPVKRQKLWRINPSHFTSTRFKITIIYIFLTAAIKVEVIGEPVRNRLLVNSNNPSHLWTCEPKFLLWHQSTRLDAERFLTDFYFLFLSLLDQISFFLLVLPVIKPLSLTCSPPHTCVCSPRTSPSCPDLQVYVVDSWEILLCGNIVKLLRFLGSVFSLGIWPVGFCCYLVSGVLVEDFYETEWRGSCHIQKYFSLSRNFNCFPPGWFLRFKVWFLQKSEAVVLFFSHELCPLWDSQ